MMTNEDAGDLFPLQRRPDAPKMSDLRTALENLHGDLLRDARTFAELAQTAATSKGRDKAAFFAALSRARAGEIERQLGWVA